MAAKVLSFAQKLSRVLNGKRHEFFNREERATYRAEIERLRHDALNLPRVG